MVTPLQYWIGVGALTALTLALPAVLILEGDLLEAMFVGLPAVFVLTGVVAGTVGMLSK